MPNVGVDQADTYKCYASNEYGRAIVTVTLNVIEGQCKTSTNVWWAESTKRKSESITWLGCAGQKKYIIFFSWVQEEQSNAGSTIRSVCIQVLSESLKQ